MFENEIQLKNLDILRCQLAKKWASPAKKDFLFKMRKTVNLKRVLLTVKTQLRSNVLSTQYTNITKTSQMENSTNKNKNQQYKYHNNQLSVFLH